MRKLVKAFAGLVSIAAISLLALITYVEHKLPDNLYIAPDEEVYLRSHLAHVNKDIPINIAPVVRDGNGNSYTLDLKLFESVPIKQVQVQIVARNMVVPGGIPFGIKMYTEGVIVVGMSDIQKGAQNLNPAKDAGIKIGDVLTYIDDKKIERRSDVARCIKQSEGNEVKITLTRDGKGMEVYLQPVKNEFDDEFRAGIWVRDSSAGIGTMTYYDPANMGFAGLGHAICDVDTGEIMPLASGEIMDVNILGSNAGHSGAPGELKGSFVGEQAIGKLFLNCESGIYGVLNKIDLPHDPVPMAMCQEITPGAATILCTISGNKPQSFDIMIEKVNYSDKNTTKNMIIKVTDPDLLTATGGIVQGMSGSPILQNGKLVGAVTHVFVNDPTRGYGIFAENMQKRLIDVENKRLAA